MPVYEALQSVYRYCLRAPAAPALSFALSFSLAHSVSISLSSLTASMLLLLIIIVISVRALACRTYITIIFCTYINKTKRRITNQGFALCVSADLHGAGGRRYGVPRDKREHPRSESPPLYTPTFHLCTYMFSRFMTSIPKGNFVVCPLLSLLRCGPK